MMSIWIDNNIVFYTINGVTCFFPIEYWNTMKNVIPLFIDGVICFAEITLQEEEKLSENNYN